MKFFSKKMLFLSTSVVLFAMAGCGSSKGANPSASVEPSASVAPKASGKEAVELVYWHFWTGDDAKMIDGIVDEFNKTHPGIKVKSVSIPGDIDTKFLTANAGGNPPDIITEGSSVVPAWADSGAIMPLDKYQSADAPDFKDWLYPVVKNMGSYNNQLYAVAFSMDAHAMIYNKDIFKAAGLDPEKPPVTIEELDAMQDKLWQKDDRGFIQRIGYMPNNIRSWNPSFDGHWVDEAGNPTATNEHNLKLFQWFQSYAKKYDATKLAAFKNSLKESGGSTNPFFSGKQAIIIDGMWALPDIKKYAPNMNYGVAPMPYPAGYGKANADLSDGNFNMIPSKAKHPEEAWQFVKWMSGYGNEKYAANMLTQGGWIPASPKIAVQPDYQAFINEIPVRKIFVDTLGSKNAKPLPGIAKGMYYSDRIKAAEEAVMTLAKTPEKALQDLQAEIEKEIKNK
ncbi:ABC transporter substrate-binding protein [Paenibacillus cymbidii]|uniref:ABC transporter substrate-binding protein n=1 Tax=Paenibacillus cymbidii TaxID=1639034 RepID=UPI0010806A86|nr:ABC transporter substrate-binding protein [Paenibacillus cymbidii]